MNVDSHVRERAVLTIFRAHHRTTRGGCLSSRDLERDWISIGLRQSDLALALDDLTRRELLRARAAPGAPDYELSYLGECALQSDMIARPIRFLRSWFTLQCARRRKRAPAPPDPRLWTRRATDRS